MIKSFFFILIYILLIGCETTKEIRSVNKIINYNFLQNQFSSPDQVESEYFENDRDLNNMQFVQRIVLDFIILIFALFLIISTPLLLIYNWVTQFFVCKKIKITRQYFLTKYNALPIRFFKIYKKSHAILVGNSFGIGAWCLATIIYINKNFNHFQEGIVAYFDFPFKIFNGIMFEENTIPNIIGLELWFDMLLIVGISILHFIIGYSIGIFVMNKYRKTYFQLSHNNQLLVP